MGDLLPLFSCFFLKLSHTQQRVFSIVFPLRFYDEFNLKKEIEYYSTAQMSHCIVEVCHHVKQSCDKCKAITSLRNFVIHSDASLTHR